MKIVVFCRCVVSDWSHGNAHFLLGVLSELQVRGVDVLVYEPKDAWALSDLIKEHGEAAAEGFRQAYPDLKVKPYEGDTLDLNKSLSGADAVVVSACNEPDLVNRIGEHRRTRGNYALFFQDNDSFSMSEDDVELDLTGYDGVLALGKVIRDRHLKEGWVKNAWVWQEAADTRLFHPLTVPEKEGDLVWVGNWEDGERATELVEMLMVPVRRLGLKAKVFGVGYNERARRILAHSGVEYGGWIPNYEVPGIYARYRATVHLPSRKHVQSLPGIPAIGLFEALACGLPVVSKPWNDVDKLFTRGDFLTARSPEEMEAQLSWVVRNEAAAKEIAEHGRRTVLESHTCSHRADELLQIIDIAQRDLVRKQSA